MDRIDKFIIDFDIWFKKFVLRYGYDKNLTVTLKGLGGKPKRNAYIKEKVAEYYLRENE